MAMVLSWTLYPLGIGVHPGTIYIFVYFFSLATKIKETERTDKKEVEEDTVDLKKEGEEEEGSDILLSCPEEVRREGKEIRAELKVLRLYQEEVRDSVKSLKVTLRNDVSEVRTFSWKIRNILVVFCMTWFG